MSKEITDLEYALCLANHINNPCIDPRTGIDIRPVYIREAKRALDKLNQPARDFLLECIQLCEKPPEYST